MVVATSRLLDPALLPIREKVLAGERLSHADGVALYRTRDIFTVGELANLVRERLHGRRAYYNINRHINYSNYCVLRCKFCSFYRPYPRQPEDAGRRGRGETHAPRPDETAARESGWPAAAGARGVPGTAEAGGDRSAALAGVPADGEQSRKPEGVARRSSIDLTPATDADGGYEYTLEQIVELAAESWERGATEVHIVGGLHPRWPFRFYTDMCRQIKARCPGLHIKAFTAIEIVHFTRISRPRLSIEEVLIALREAGLGSLPGGGAEIFDDRVHDEAFRAKVGEKHWFDVHRIAHDLGIPSNATMLYGHIETIEERITHLLKLREHQDESLARMKDAERSMRDGQCEMRSASRQQEAPRRDARDLVGAGHGAGTQPTRSPADPLPAGRNLPAAFQCCIPLSFIPEGSEFGHLPGPTGLDDLKTLAIARLMLDNFPHIKAFWPMQSAKLSQVALNWGVDDFDGTVVWYDITRREGRGSNRQELTVEQIQRLIREAGCEPVERDTLYHTVFRDAAGRIVAGSWRQAECRG